MVTTYVGPEGLRYEPWAMVTTYVAQAFRPAGRRRAMEIQWSKNPDEALERAKREKKPVLLDFSAAPM
jgi:hypothetical protein